MALSVSTQVNPVGTKLIVQTDADEEVDVNVTGASGTIYMVDVDNTANPAEDNYLKVYDDAAPVVGTTAPDHIFRFKGNERRVIAIPEGLDFNVLSFACVTSPGTAGVTGPTNPVVVRMVTS